MPCIRFLEKKKKKEKKKGPPKQNADEWGKWRTNSKIIIKEILKPQLKNEELKGSEVIWNLHKTHKACAILPH